MWIKKGSRHSLVRSIGTKHFCLVSYDTVSSSINEGFSFWIKDDVVWYWWKNLCKIQVEFYIIMFHYCTRFCRCTVIFQEITLSMEFGMNKLCCSVWYHWLTLCINVIRKTMMNYLNSCLDFESLFCVKAVRMKATTRILIFTSRFDNNFEPTLLEYSWVLPVAWRE